jgi:hypothetical protein
MPGVGSTCPVRGGGTDISGWARLRREAVAEFAAAGAEILGDDPVAARAIAARISDRTPDG